MGEKGGAGAAGTVAAVAAICVGVALSYFGYLLPLNALNPAELLGSALFWGAVVYLVLGVLFRRAVGEFERAVRSRLGAAVFAGYLTAHLLLYGFVLEGIISATFGPSLLSVSQSTFLVTTDVFSPPSLLSALFDISYNPSITLAFEPVFSAALSFYSVAVALIIDVLVVASIGKTRELGRLCSARKRATSFVAVPALGILLGASCCLSVAGLVSLYTLPLAVASVLSASLPLYYVTYFVLPSFAIAVLYLNLRSVRGFASRVAPSSAAPEAGGASQSDEW